jgi:hypothetical protein
MNNYTVEFTNIPGTHRFGIYKVYDVIDQAAAIAQAEEDLLEDNTWVNKPGYRQDICIHITPLKE